MSSSRPLPELETVEAGDSMEDDIKQDECIERNVITSSMMQAIDSDDIEQQAAVVNQLRIILQKEDRPSDEVIQKGIIPKLVKFLEMDENSELQFDAAWSLTNIAAGTSSQTRPLVDAGAVPVLIRLLSSVVENVRHQAAWTLANIAGDCPEFRDHVLNHGAMTPLLQMLNDSNENTTEIVAWAVYCFCRGNNPSPNLDEISVCLPTLNRLSFLRNEKVLIHVCWAYYYLCDNSRGREMVIDSGVCPKLVELMTHDNDKIVRTALLCVGNIVRGDDVQTQVIVNCNALQRIRPLLAHGEENIKKNACWVLSNIAAGNEVQIQAVIDADVFPLLIQMFHTEEFSTRKEALWTIRNGLTRGSEKQIRFIAQQGCVSSLCSMLTSTNREIVLLCLESLRPILLLGDRDSKLIGGLNPYAVMVEACRGLEIMRLLRNNEIVDMVRVLSTVIARDFFSTE